MTQLEAWASNDALIAPDRFACPHGAGAWQQPQDHQRLLPFPVDPDGGRQRPGEAEHAQGCRL